MNASVYGAALHWHALKIRRNWGASKKEVAFQVKSFRICLIFILKYLIFGNSWIGGLAAHPVGSEILFYFRSADSHLPPMGGDGLVSLKIVRMCRSWNIVKWRGSSVGESVGFITRRSTVRFRPTLLGNCPKEIKKLYRHWTQLLKLHQRRVKCNTVTKLILFGILRETPANFSCGIWFWYSYVDWFADMFAIDSNVKRLFLLSETFEWKDPEAVS